MQLLIQTYPEALLTADKFFHAVPLHYYLQGSHQTLGCTRDEVLEVLVETCPITLYMTDAGGFYPIHCAG